MIIKIHNVETNEIIEREMLDNELQEFNKSKENAEKVIWEATQIATAKAALLEKLGITEEEAKLLLS